ncbi:MAG: winged helix-turn-helix domain-containing protein [Acidobacteriaceae bacterium]
MDDAEIDLAGHAVCLCGREVHLTSKEFDLPVYLARRAGKIVHHRELLSAIWAPIIPNNPNTCECSQNSFAGNWKQRVPGTTS